MTAPSTLQDEQELKPLVVSGSTARRLLDIGETKYWEMTKRGEIEIVMVGGRKMATYASLERLAKPKAP